MEEWNGTDRPERKVFFVIYIILFWLLSIKEISLYPRHFCRVEYRTRDLPNLPKLSYRMPHFTTYVLKKILRSPIVLPISAKKYTLYFQSFILIRFFPFFVILRQKSTFFYFAFLNSFASKRKFLLFNPFIAAGTGYRYLFSSTLVVFVLACV
jgi:hypothetical protein